MPNSNKRIIQKAEKVVGDAMDVEVLYCKLGDLTHSIYNQLERDNLIESAVKLRTNVTMPFVGLADMKKTKNSTEESLRDSCTGECIEQLVTKLNICTKRLVDELTAVVSYVKTFTAVLPGSYDEKNAQAGQLFREIIHKDKTIARRYLPNLDYNYYGQDGHPVPYA